MAYISSQYGDGDVSTSVGGGGFSGGGSDVSDLFRRLVERRLALEEAPARRPGFAGKGVNQAAPVTQRVISGEGSASGRPPDPLAAQKAADRYEMRQRSAAMRPTGLGAQMIPGMAVDPRLLPSRLLPSGSAMAGAPGPSMAGLSPSEPEPQELPNSGYAFMSPVERARWDAAAARSGRR